MAGNSLYCSICSFPYFFERRYFSLLQSSVFSNGLQLVCLPFLPYKQVIPNSLPVKFSSRSYFCAYFSLPSSIWSESFLDPDIYIKPLFPVNKQFSIGSFLDWEGHHQDTLLITHITPIGLAPLSP